jgi:hypothetical protein
MKKYDIVSGVPASYNGVYWEPVSGVDYCWDYGRVFDSVRGDPKSERRVVRELILSDLFFIVYFVLKIPHFNHPFVVDACRSISEGPKSYTLDLWAREHGKTSIVTVGETLQLLLGDREATFGIFSYAQIPSISILRSIKRILETDELLKWCFPDVLYSNPVSESPLWSEGQGIIVRRQGYQKEASVEACGLIDSMPTGKHFKHRRYDDVVTEKVVPPHASADTMDKVKMSFDLSENLGSEGGTTRVIGTYYHHEDPLVYIGSKRLADGTPVYTTRIKPATEDGAFNGKSVFLSEERLAILRTNPRTFATQQLLNPTPDELAQLDPNHLVEVEPHEIPKRLFRFIPVDFAGVNKQREGDAWAIHLIGVDPVLDNTGGSDIYIIDSVIKPMSMTNALDSIVDLYARGGLVWEVAVEKVAASTMEVHVKNALLARGKRSANVKTVSPSGRKKEYRITQALEWPLRNGKIKINRAIPLEYRERLRTEMKRFPYWHDDGLDALAYVYDLLNDFPFSRHRSQLKAEGDDLWKKSDRWSELDPKRRSEKSWLYV